MHTSCACPSVSPFLGSAELRSHIAYLVSLAGIMRLLERTLTECDLAGCMRLLHHLPDTLSADDIIAATRAVPLSPLALEEMLYE